MHRSKDTPGYDLQKSSFEVKVKHSGMLKGGVIMDVTTPEQAKIAEDAGAVAVMISEKLCAEMKDCECVNKMTNPVLIQQVQEQVSIPVIAKCRLGHIVEAQILEALFVDYIDESEVLTPVDYQHYIDKHEFRIPFICGASDLGSALRRIGEGASLIRTIGEAGSGNIAKTVENLRAIRQQIHALRCLDSSELRQTAERMGTTYELVVEVAELGALPVPFFAAGGISNPADAALVMRLGAQSVFAGSEIFSAEDPLTHAKAIVGGVTYYNDPEMLAKVTLGYFNDVTGSEMRVLAKEEELLKRE